MPRSVMQRRIRMAAGFLSAGLLVELLALLWSYPIAFLVSVLVGIPLVGLGILIFLYSLVSVRE